jgi:hypothetical protein
LVLGFEALELREKYCGRSTAGEIIREKYCGRITAGELRAPKGISRFNLPHHLSRIISPASSLPQ